MRAVPNLSPRLHKQVHIWVCAHMHTEIPAHLFMTADSSHLCARPYSPSRSSLLLIFTRKRSASLFLSSFFSHWRPDVRLWHASYAVPLCFTVLQADRKEVCMKAGTTVQVKGVAEDAGEGDETESEAKKRGGREMSEEPRRKVTEYEVSLETLRGSGRRERQG